MKTCIVEGCSASAWVKKMCRPHYRRNSIYGDPQGAPRIQSRAERFWAKVEKTETCWNWTAGKTHDGYGRFRVDVEHGAHAHRVSYEMEVGPINPGLMIDHKCHNRACVNPAHLRAVTNKQNQENRIGAESSSSTGVRGVFWDKRIGKYYAQVVHHGKRYFAGNHATITEAEAAAIAKRNELYTCNILDRVA